MPVISIDMAETIAFQTIFQGASLCRPSNIGKTRACRQHARMAVSQTEAETFSYPRRVQRAVVWFRDGDLRLQDHYGLQEACEHTCEALAPLLVVTPRSTPETLKAAARLQKELHRRGSHLVLRYAEDEGKAVVDFLREYKADRVHVRLDVESEAYDVIMKVEDAVDGQTTVKTWRMELHEWDNDDARALSDLPYDFSNFLKWRPRLITPICTSTVDFEPDVILPGPSLSNDDFPIEEVTQQYENTSPAYSYQSSTFEAELRADEGYVNTYSFDNSDETSAEKWLREFLQRSDNYEEPDAGRWLNELFRLGALSQGRMFEIINEHERQNGRIWKFFYREGAKKLLDWLNAREHMTLMARRDLSLNVTVDGEHKPKFWRWNGLLMRYVEEGREHSQNGNPPLLLVHGFGASSQHFRRSIRVLKKKYHVFALDLVGFGRSEKPPMQFTQMFWETNIFDFVREVVGKPVFVAGNSIGGYLSCAFGADSYPRWCKGICLINTAGKLEVVTTASRGSPQPDGLFKYVMKRSWRVRNAVGKAILSSLQGRSDQLLKRCYPVNPDAADEELLTEINRNSTDYGAAIVLGSGFVLPPARSLSQVLSIYNGPLLVFQGLLDPLNDARKRADTIEEQYPMAKVVRVQGGHCPHEEVADQFVDAISDWMDTINSGSADEHEMNKHKEVVPSLGAPMNKRNN